MTAEYTKYIVDDIGPSVCDKCGASGRYIKEVVSHIEPRELCWDCIEEIDAEATERVRDDSTDTTDQLKAFIEILERHFGASVVLHFPDESESPTDAHTVTVDGVESAEVTHHSDQNVVRITHTVPDSEPTILAGEGLSITGITAP